MDCEAFERIVLDRLYLELDEQSMGAAQRHVAHCSRCRGIEAGLKATRDVCRVPIVSASNEFMERVISNERRIRAVLPLRQRTSRAVSLLAGYAMRPQPTMAALLLLMIGASLFLVRARPPERDLVQVTERGVQEGEVDARRLRGSSSLASASGALGSNNALAPTSTGRADSSADSCNGTNGPGCGNRLKSGESVVVKSDADPVSLEAEYRTARQLQFRSGCSAAVQNFESIRRRQPKSEVGLAATWQAADCYSKLNRKEEARALLVLLVESPEYAVRASEQLKTLSEM
jgi:hypothetical protein